MPGQMSSQCSSRDVVERLVHALVHHLEGRLVDAAVDDVGLEPRLDLRDGLLVAAERGGLELDVRVHLEERLHVLGVEPVGVGVETDRAGDRRGIGRRRGIRRRRPARAAGSSSSPQAVVTSDRARHDREAAKESGSTPWRYPSVTVRRDRHVTRRRPYRAGCRLSTVDRGAGRTYRPAESERRGVPR